MRAAVVLLAAGRGARMGGRTPKAYLRLGGIPLYRHSLETFQSMREVRQVVLVVPPGMKEGVPGGARRQDSVQNGLKALDQAYDVVLVHDSARPFVSPDLIRRVLKAALERGGAIPGLPLRDTLKRVDGKGLIESTPSREGLWTVQTPQGFRKGVLEAAYAAGHGIQDATDDAQIVERAGGNVVVVEGNPRNFKITSKIDLELAEDYLRQRRRPRTPRGTPGS